MRLRLQPDVVVANVRGVLADEASDVNVLKKTVFDLKGLLQNDIPAPWPERHLNRLRQLPDSTTHRFTCLVIKSNFLGSHCDFFPSLHSGENSTDLFRLESGTTRPVCVTIPPPPEHRPRS